MGRERWSQLFAVVGLVAVTASVLVLGITGQVRNTEVAQEATADLLAVPTQRDAVAAALSAALDRAFPALALSDAEQTFAVERMLANGDLIDEVELALEAGHQSWLSGSLLSLDLDPRVATSVAIAGIRDASPAAVDSLGSQSRVEPPPIEIPTWISAATVNTYRSGALVALAVGALAVLAGVVLGFRWSQTWQRLARGLILLGLLLAAVVLLLPWSAVNQLDDRLAVLGALLVPSSTSWLVAAAVTIVVGLSLHGRADRMKAQTPQVDRARPRRDAAPARSGGAPSVATRKAVRHRTEAIDAFFEPAEVKAPAPAGVVDLADLDLADLDEGDVVASGVVADEDLADDECPAVLAAASDDGEEGGDDDTEGDEPPARREPTPEEERAEALATERREALERIDGTRSRYRTHLRR